jgi:dTDP-4-dehydrorhamnose reductase
MNLPNPMRILVTGADGQLGRALRSESVRHATHEYLFADRRLLPIDEPDRVRAVFSEWRPTLCINAAAYTAVDRAETDVEQAYRINAEAVGWLASACRDYGARLLHVSTDYVFRGDGQRPYREDDPTDPQSVYGASKRQGEKSVFREAPDSMIVRTSWVYYEEGANFVRTMIRLMKDRASVGVVADQWGCPTYARDLADCLLRIADDGRLPPGIFHYCNQGAITWHAFATAIRDILGSACEVRAITTAEYPTPVRRPAYSVLDTTRIRETFGIVPPPWRTSLEECMRRIEAAS